MKTGSFIKRGLFVGAACAAMFVAPVGQAGTLIVDGINGEGVDIHGLVNEGTTAGTFNGRFDGGPTFYFWCIDLFHSVSVPGGPYSDYTLAPFDTGPLFDATRDGELRTLFSQAYGPSRITDAHAAAVFQVAIWDILFDNDHDLSTWNSIAHTGFGATGNATTISEAQDLITAAKGGTSPFALTQLTNASQPQIQDFITRGPSRLVPEPTGLALLGAGLVSMMLGMRRRKTDEHAV